MSEPLKLCVDCAHYSIDAQDCMHPNNLYRSLVDGKERPKQSPSWLRDGGPCERSAHWWEQREVNQSKET